MGTAARELTGTVTAKARYIRMSASKVREVAVLIKGKQIDEARRILAFTPKAAAREISKVLESAVANAEHNFHLPQEELIVKLASADEGLTMKRLRPRARGRANRIRKRMCSINIVLERSEELAALAQAPAPRRRARAAGGATRGAATAKGAEGAKEAAPRRRRKAEAEAPAAKGAAASKPEDSAAAEEVTDSGVVEKPEMEPEVEAPAEEVATPEAEVATGEVEPESASAEESAEPSASEEPPAAESQSEDEEGKS